MKKLIELLTYEFKRIQSSKKYGCPHCNIDCPYHCNDGYGVDYCAMQIVIDGLKQDG